MRGKLSSNEVMWNRERARLLGRSANLDGKPITANPYHENSTDDLKLSWEFGWKLAKRESK